MPRHPDKVNGNIHHGLSKQSLIFEKQKKTKCVKYFFSTFWSPGIAFWIKFKKQTKILLPYVKKDHVFVTVQFLSLHLMNNLVTIEKLGKILDYLLNNAYYKKWWGLQIY